MLQGERRRPPGPLRFNDELSYATNAISLAEERYNPSHSRSVRNISQQQLE